MNTTTIAPPANGTEHTPEMVAAYNKTLGVVLVAFCICVFFCILSGMVRCWFQKRKLDHLRHHLVPMYSFDPNEGDDWEADLPEVVLDAKPAKKQPDYQTIGSGAKDIVLSPQC